MGILHRARERRSEVGTARFLREAVRFALERPMTPLCNRAFRFRHGHGVDVMDEEWDTLVLLDACRYDVFAEVNDLEGSLEAHISSGRMSWEFMQANFVGRELHDTVYVTANPYVVNLKPGVFHAVVDTPLTEHWDDEVETVWPEDVTDVALDAHERYPDKRLIVHYMQPHVPYIGETGRELDRRVPTRGFHRYRTVEGDRDGGGDELTGDPIWAAVREGTVDRKQVEEAYRETLAIALEAVERLLSGLDGRTVVSSDHGEMFGERPCGLLPKGYGHGRMPWNRPLCEVPWLVIEGQSRRRTLPEPPVADARLDEDEAERQLEALGYRT